MLSLLIATVLAQAPSPISLSFDDAVTFASERATARADRWLAEAADSVAAATWRDAFLPTLGAEGGYSRRDRDLTLETPIGDLELGAKTRLNLNARITQPLLDVAKMVYARGAANDQARAARLQAGWTREDAIRDAVERYLDVAALDAQLRANDGFISALEARRDEVAVLVEQGRAVRVDLLRIELAYDDATQARLALSEQRKVALAALARATGQREVTAIDASSVRPFELQSELDTTRIATEGRQDLAALRARAESLGDEARANWASYLPRLEGRGEMIYDDAAIYAEEVFFQASVNVIWAPFAAATRPALADASEARRRSLLARIEDAELGIALAVRDAFARLRTARGEREVAERGVDQALETVRVERERYAEGQIVVSDLLDAERILRDRRARLDVAELDLIRAQTRVRAAAGTLAKSIDE